MAKNPFPECPICRLVYAAEGQPITIAVGCLELAKQHRCVCTDRHHPLLFTHPHTRPGCLGYRSVSGLKIEVIDRESEQGEHATELQT